MTTSRSARLEPRPIATLEGGNRRRFRRQDGLRYPEIPDPAEALDALRPEQARWLRHFNRAGLEARIAWVKYR